MSEGTIALVTGGARGIGLACAEALGKDGHRLILVDIDAEALARAARSLGEGTVSLPCDMGNPEDVRSLFKTVIKEHGTPDVLVNNAGIALPGDFLNYSEDDFRRVMNVNLIGTFVATQCAANAMIEAGIPGAIINMSSVNSQVAISAIPAYCASKGGIMQLTKASALALAPHGIRVNAVGPGSIDTAMMAGVNSNPEALRTALSRTPLGRLGSPREIGDVVAFLASKRASYITGETIYVDGGRLALNYTC